MRNIIGRCISSIFLSLFLLSSLSSCSFFFDKFNDPTYDVINLDSKDFGIVFSHNVNGETHPCGCRHFPLGGLAQVAGVLEKLKKTQTVVYVDTGDTLFASNNIPKSLEKSQTYNAKELASALSKVGLRYWLPGDQDFAKGVSFLTEVLEETNIQPVISNLVNPKTMRHKEIVLFEKGPHKIFLVGLINPAIMASEYRKLFKTPEKVFPELLKKLKEKGFKNKDPFHRLVVLSHAGINRDEQLAKEFPNIDWIVGAHTMNFLRFAQEEGNVKIVQVLSRNHYLGHITFSMTGDKRKDAYEIIEVREELKDELKPNPFLAFIDKHKENLSKVQKKEQDEMVKGNLGTIRYSTSSSCLDCHDKQTDFWRGTSHSLAYHTLVVAKEENNLTCVKCHSLGLEDIKGFTKVSNMIEFDKSRHRLEFSKDGGKKLNKRYWSELKEAFGKTKSVRNMASAKKKKLSKSWFKHDQSFSVNRNFANVQCLNCHSQHEGHPFDKFDPIPSREQKLAGMKNKCLNCHDSDQSPEWYDKRANGLPGAPNQDIITKKIKLISCPELSKEEREEFN
jgi:nitrate reductase cytochrome c-type subunit